MRLETIEQRGRKLGDSVANRPVGNSTGASECLLPYASFKPTPRRPWEKQLKAAKPHAALYRCDNSAHPSTRAVRGLRQFKSPLSGCQAAPAKELFRPRGGVKVKRSHLSYLHRRTCLNFVEGSLWRKAFFSPMTHSALPSKNTVLTQLLKFLNKSFKFAVIAILSYF